MSGKHKVTFFKMLLPYVDIYDNKKENKKLLWLIIDSIDEEYFIKLFSSLEVLLISLNEKNFERAYDLVSTYKDKLLTQEVIDIAASLNKRSKVFKEYFYAKKDGFSCANNINIEVDKMLEKNATEDDIMQFTMIYNSDFKEEKERVFKYLCLKNKSVK